MKIKKYLKKHVLNFPERKIKLISIVLLSVICLVSLSFNMIKLKDNHTYEIPKAYRFDRFYSFDELHYSKYVYSSDKAGKYNSPSVAVKHPLLSYWGNIFTKNIEKTSLIHSHQNKYAAVVSMQILLTMISAIFLYLIFFDILKIGNFYSVLLSLLYMFTNSTIIASLLIESFIVSGTLLILSFYFISKKRYTISGILGGLVFGTTITNVVIWGLMVIGIVGFKNYKEILKIAVSFILTLVFLMFVIFLLEKNYLIFLLTNFFDTVKENSAIYRFNTSFFGIIKYSYYFIIGAPFLYLNTVDTTQIGHNRGYAISFIPKANIYISILILIIIFILIYLIFLGIKNKNKYSIACLFMLAFNFTLHCLFKFGLHEAFIYAPHYLFSYLILFGISLKYSKNLKIYLTVFIIILLSSSIIINFKSINDIIFVINQGLRG